MMKILQNVQNYFAMLGIRSSNSLQQHPFNMKNSVIFLIFTVLFFMSHIFLFCKASSLAEYADGLYQCVTGDFIHIDFVIHIYIVTKLVKFIDNFEKVIQKSK